MMPERSVSPARNNSRALRARKYDDRTKRVRGVVFLETVCCHQEVVNSTLGGGGYIRDIDWLMNMYLLQGYDTTHQYFKYLMESFFGKYLPRQSRLSYEVAWKAMAILGRWAKSPPPYRVRLHYRQGDYRHFWITGDYPEAMRNIFLDISCLEPTPGEGPNIA